MKKFNKEKLVEFRVSLENRNIKLHTFKKEFTLFKKLCYLVLTEKVSVQAAVDKAVKIAINYNPRYGY